MLLAINECCKPGEKFKRIGEVIYEYSKLFGYHVNEHFAGHGIGKEMHCDPLIFHNLDNKNES